MRMETKERKRKKKRAEEGRGEVGTHEGEKGRRAGKGRGK